MTRFKTHTGSVYSVDCEKMTWEREAKTDRSGDIREGLEGPGENGTLVRCPDIKEGKSVLLLGRDRYVITSWVEEILAA